MGNQCETFIPSRLEHIALLPHQTNNSELKSIIGFNTFFVIVQQIIFKLI